jgi:RNA polymerase sigma-70 factor, ECF subfamily
MNSLLTSLYPRLLQQAELLMARFPGHALQPSDLLHMALERILRRPPAVEFHVEPMILGLVVQVMRRALVDEHRRSQAARRGEGVHPVPLDMAAEVPAVEHEQWPEVNEALARLRQSQPAAADLIELRFFQGVPQYEIARHLSISPGTMSRRWQSAASWLREALNFATASARAA